MDKTKTSLNSDSHEDPFENDCNAELLDDTSDITVHLPNNVPSCPARVWGRIIYFLKCITVEPSVIGTMYIAVMYSMTAKQYIYDRLALSYNLTDSDRNHSCDATFANESDPEYVLQQKVSAETSQWTMYTLIASFVIATFSTILLGSWSDKVGRKIPLLLSQFGLIILMSTYVLVVNLDLPIPFLLVGHVISGLLGDLSNTLGCSFSYVADINTRRDRTFHMSVLEACIGIGGFTAAITGGIWLSAQGFANPFWFMLAVAIFDFTYVLLRLPSTHSGRIFENFRHLFSKQQFIHMYRVMKPKDDDNSRPLNLILFCVCFLTLTIVSSGVRDILVIYEIGLPFCWDSLLVGLSLSLNHLNYFVSMIMVKIFHKPSSEKNMLISGSVLAAVSCIILAFANSTLMIFIGLFLLLFFNLPFPILRSQTSRLVTKDEVGSVFATVSCAQNIGNVLATVIFNDVFSATVKSDFPGAVFLVGVGLLAFSTPLYWWAYQRTKHILSEEVHEYDPMVNEVQQ